VSELCRHFLAKAALGGAPEREISAEASPSSPLELAGKRPRARQLHRTPRRDERRAPRLRGDGGPRPKRGSLGKSEPLVARRYGALALAEARELFERDYLVQKLRECDYNVAKAADASGIHPSGLHAKIKKFGIEQER